MSKNLVIGGLLAAVSAVGLQAAPAHAATPRTATQAASTQTAAAQSAAAQGTTAPAAWTRPAPAPLHWGPVRSRAGHRGYATADVWITRFTAETFVVSGSLYDRDAHGGHCAYIRARFHYIGGGTGWALPRTTCASRNAFRLSSDGRIKRVDVKVCVVDRARRTTLNCHSDAITPGIIAGWPQ
ncbi:hypothetical protein AB0C10_23560 [Microbispora amethystogenes]|uniref:hypothetical protein n=1 Tax=Microbispora amethystogenes TaxID=1427754 RepID=UPI0033EAACA6